LVLDHAGSIPAPGIMKKNMVENKHLREYIEENDVSATKIAYRLGYERKQYTTYTTIHGIENKYRGYKTADATRVRRELGMKHEKSHGKFYFRKYIGESKALKYCNALDIDPVDIGL
jgi:hypothetical protein